MFYRGNFTGGILLPPFLHPVCQRSPPAREVGEPPQEPKGIPTSQRLKKAPGKAEVPRQTSDFYCTEATFHLPPLFLISLNGLETGLMEINGIQQKSHQRPAVSHARSRNKGSFHVSL